VRAERENSKKFAESFAGKANYDVLLENPDCGNLKTPQLGHALDTLQARLSAQFKNAIEAPKYFRSIAIKSSRLGLP